MSLIDDDIDGELLALMAGALPAPAVDPSRKARLLSSLDDVVPFAQFLDRIAALTDLARDRAHALLMSLDDASRWIGGGTDMAIFHIDAGPRLQNAIVGFVRLPAGAHFPEHEHVGAEVMLVMQGGAVVDGVTHCAGAEVTAEPGSTHTVVAAEGPDLLYLGIIQGGMKIDGNTIAPSDPAF